ncbi:hypothetical protein [Mycoplasma struthionis]|uniref:Variable surface lipoprotein n=1 Tax=Mycoplasma struthionis TaxID=538220 RepID=A0A502M3J2_9MOLU|nr:hypothetical protein [Mycoplasma struthionis]TPI01502.1 hypothetical protein FJM01_02540 [Mycoplasma struthionis]
MSIKKKISVLLLTISAPTIAIAPALMAAACQSGNSKTNEKKNEDNKKNLADEAKKEEEERVKANTAKIEKIEAKKEEIKGLKTKIDSIVKESDPVEVKNAKKYVIATLSALPGVKEAFALIAEAKLSPSSQNSLVDEKETAVNSKLEEAKKLIGTKSLELTVVAVKSADETPVPTLNGNLKAVATGVKIVLEDQLTPTTQLDAAIAKIDELKKLSAQMATPENMNLDSKLDLAVKAQVFIPRNFKRNSGCFTRNFNRHTWSFKRKESWNN